MVIINNRKWITLNDEIKVNGKKIVKIYEADRKIYPKETSIRIYWVSYDIYGQYLPFTTNWPNYPSEYSVEQLYDYAKKHPCIRSKTDEGNGKYTIVFEQDGAILTIQHAPEDMIGIFYLYSDQGGGWPNFRMYSKDSISLSYGLVATTSGNIQPQGLYGDGSFIYNE